MNAEHTRGIDPAKIEVPVIIKKNPKYIGFRDIRYGPDVIRVVGRPVGQMSVLLILNSDQDHIMRKNPRKKVAEPAMGCECTVTIRL
jgi:hypothetical protein